MEPVSLGVKLNIWASSMIQSLGYIGIFVVSFVGSASVIFPIPVFIVVPATAALPGMNPWLVGLFAGVGSSLGEVVGYVVGMGGGKLVEKKYSQHIDKYKKWFKDGKNMFFWIVAFAATPLPDDVVGLVCGIFRYAFKKFILASFIGKIILNLVLALGGYYAIPWILRFFGIVL